MTLAYYRPRTATRLLYHCVDDIQAQPDMPANTLTVWESRLCRRAEVVYTTSPSLCTSRMRWNANTYFLPNVADNRHFGRALLDELAIPEELLALPSPRIGFVGSVSAYKLDFDLIATLARCRPNWSWVFVGPIGEGEGNTDLSTLLREKNIYLLGHRPYQDLPSYMKGFDVGLLPLRNNTYTHSMFPMKFFEYLASGLPVVATSIDPLREYQSLAHLVPPSPTAFLDAIEASINESKRSARRRQRIEAVGQFNYHTRTRSMLAKIGHQLP